MPSARPSQEGRRIQRETFPSGKSLFVFSNFLPTTHTLKLKLVEAISLGGGLTSDGEETSGFFKLQKIRTRGKI